MAGVIRMKTMMVAIIDVGPSMKNSTTENKSSVTEMSKLNIAKSYIACFVLSRMMAVKTAEFCIVLSGDDRTNNYLNINQGGGYDRINELFPMSRAGTNLIEVVHGISHGNSPGDTIDGIVVGFDILDRTNVGKAYNKVMVLVTDGENEIDGLDDLESIETNMKKKDCAFYVLFMGTITGDSSATKIRNAGVLQNLAKSTGGRFCQANDLGDCFPLLNAAPGMCSKPREQKFVFEISPYMRVPCIVWNKTKSISLPSLKKGPIGAEQGDSNELSTVKTELTYRNPADEDEEVSMGDRIKGFKYGAQYIPIQEDEQNAFRILGPQGITLIGFVASSAVPRHHYLTKAVVFEGNPEIDTAVSTVRSLYSAMQTTNTVALIRYVSRENSEPYLGVLLPNVSGGDNGSSFILHRLPVADDIREYAFPTFNTDTLESEQKHAASSFIDSMTVKSPVPSQIRPFNPTAVELLLELQKRYLNGRSSDFEIPTFKEPLSAGQQASIQNLRSQFPLKLSVETSLKRKVFWSDIQISSSDNATSTSTSTSSADSTGKGKGKGNKKLQTDGQANEEHNNDLEVSSQTASSKVLSPSIGALLAAASIAVQQFSEGSLNPVEEFLAVMVTIATLPKNVESDGNNGSKEKTARQEIAEQVMTSMTGVIEKMVTAGGSAAYHRKGVACLEVFRTAAVDENVPKVFNTFMVDVVKEFYRSMPRYRPFWDMIVVKNITLISSAEAESSEVSVDMAAKFLLEEEVVVEVEVVAAAGDEEDDMFAEMQ